MSRRGLSFQGILEPDSREEEGEMAVWWIGKSGSDSFCDDDMSNESCGIVNDYLVFRELDRCVKQDER